MFCLQNSTVACNLAPHGGRLGCVRTNRNAARFSHHFCRGRASTVAEQQGNPLERKIIFFHRRGDSRIARLSLRNLFLHRRAGACSRRFGCGYRLFFGQSCCFATADARSLKYWAWREQAALYDYFATPSLWKIYTGTALQPWQRLPAFEKSDAPLIVSQKVSWP